MILSNIPSIARGEVTVSPDAWEMLRQIAKVPLSEHTLPLVCADKICDENTISRVAALRMVANERTALRHARDFALVCFLLHECANISDMHGLYSRTREKCKTAAGLTPLAPTPIDINTTRRSPVLFDPRDGNYYTREGYELDNSVALVDATQVRVSVGARWVLRHALNHAERRRLITCYDVWKLLRKKRDEAMGQLY